jgi:hypothetical protein
MRTTPCSKIPDLYVDGGMASPKGGHLKTRPLLFAAGFDRKAARRPAMSSRPALAVRAVADRRRSGSGSDGFELIETLVYNLDEFSVGRIVESTAESDVEHGHPHVGGETRRRFRYSTLLQGQCERRGERRALDQFALLQVRVRGDDPPAFAGEGTPSVHEARRGFDRDPPARGGRVHRASDGSFHLIIHDDRD